MEPIPTESIVRAVVAANLEGRWLLDHPFYRRWEAGQLSEAELASYAGQYRHVERALPGVLADIALGLEEGPARVLVEATLSDERGNPRSHVALFDDFARAVGAADDPPAPATAALIGLQTDRARRDARAGLATVAAYEVQAAEVASSKADGLRRHYRLGPEGTRFWDVHAALEAEHADWSLAALAELVEHPGDLAEPLRRSADAWWAFLDERQALAPVG